MPSTYKDTLKMYVIIINFYDAYNYGYRKPLLPIKGEKNTLKRAKI